MGRSPSPVVAGVASPSWVNSRTEGKLRQQEDSSNLQTRGPGRCRGPNQQPGSYGPQRGLPPRPSGPATPAIGPVSRLKAQPIAVGLALLSVGFIAAAIMLSLPGASSNKYGGLPSWLPKAAVPIGRVVDASAARPWLAVEGDTVHVELARGNVMVTTVGPRVPEIGEVPVPSTTLCTFAVTFTSATGVVPINPRAFTIRDEFGNYHYPKVTAQGGRAVPADIPAGKTVTLYMSDVLPTGEGQLRWAPEGHEPTVSWDFDVEID